ncbi:MAG: TonB-dependent receptor [Acidobacteriaceae bacterium]|nr:TonB-dependent receptor [Acidobacteriaceae bacterium]
MLLKKLRLLSAGALISFFLFAFSGVSQEFRATVSGHVLDSSGRAIPKAQVEVVSLANNAISTAVTDDSGSYTVPLLQPGDYRLTIKAAGFKQYVNDRLTLTVGQIAGVDATLELGAVTETVEVTSQAELLETQTASGGGVVDTLQVTELPLNARNPFMLGNMMSGVTFTGASIWQRPFDNGAIAQWIVNGGWQSNNEFLLDGAPNNAQMGSNNIAYVPIVDAVQEFSIQQNTYDAQYGHTSGGVMNTVLKSGGSQFHGTGWDFLRRTWLDANTFQNNAVGSPKTNHFLNQYGGQVSGPVYIPKLLKKDSKVKLFYLGSFENYHEGTPNPLTLSYPEPDMRTGDFSKLTDANGNLIKIYDPMTAVYDASGNTITPRQQFPGNIIPANRLNPVALAVTKYMPLPNTTSVGAGYSFNDLRIPNYFDTDQFYNLILKFDWNFGDKDRVFVRHASNDRTETRSDNGLVNQPGESGQLPFQRINDAYVVDWVRTINPTLVSNLRVSYNRFIEKGLAAASLGFNLSNLDLPQSLISQLPEPVGFGYWQFNGYTNMGRNPQVGKNITDDYALNANITKVWGNHSVHTGVDLRWNQYAIDDTGNILGFAVDNSFTANDWQQPNGVSGNSYASFLLGYQNANNGTTPSSNYPAYPFFKQWYIAPFIQDDFKVSPKLTLNLGLRWDFNLPPYEIHNRLNTGFNTNAPSPISALISPTNLALYPQLANLKGSMTFAGVNGATSEASGIRWFNLQPRVGFAYRITDKLVMRGGYGRYFMNPNNDYLQYNGFSNNTPIVTSLDGGRTPIQNAVSNPYPNGINPPPGASLGALSYAGRGFNWFDPNFKIPSSNQFSFGFQYQVTKASFLELKYVGNYIMNLQTSSTVAGSGTWNDPGLAVRQSCNALEGGNASYCNAQVPNPFYGLAPFAGTSLGVSPTVNRYQMLRPYPQFTGMTQLGRNDGFVHYNSFQTTYNYRFRGGLTLNANYTFSKQLERWGFNDWQKQIPQTGLYYQDRPHVIKITPVYELPFGQGQRWGNSTNGFVRRLIGGWEVTSFFAYNSGIPANLPQNAIMLKNPAVTPNFHDYKVRGWSPCVLQEFNDGTIAPLQNSINAGCGTDPSTYSWLTLPSYAPAVNSFRSGQIRMSSAITMDASLNKTTHITERLSLQLRFEAFNVLNHFTDIYDTYNTNPFDANFGTYIPSNAWIGNTVYPRQLQLGAKINW